MTLRKVLLALASLAIGFRVGPAGAQIDASVQDQPEVSREQIDFFIQRAALDSSAADLLRAMHGTYEIAYGEAWRAFRADFERDQRAAFESGDRGDENERARLGEALRSQVASWRRERSELLLSFLDDSTIALPQAHAGAWGAFARSARRARIMEELDPYALDSGIFDLEAQIEMIDLNEDERREVDQLLDQYAAEMDAVVTAVQSRIDDWYERSQDPNLDEESRMRVRTECEAWQAQVRAVNTRFLSQAAAALTEHRPEFEAIETARKNPALYVPSPVDRVLTILREGDIVPAGEMVAFEEAYNSYLGRRASLRRQFLQAHARWLPGTAERWAKRDELLRHAIETGERINANEALHGHPGMPAMAELFALEERTLAAIRQGLSEEEFARVSLEAQILLEWPDPENGRR